MLPNNQNKQTKKPNETPKQYLVLNLTNLFAKFLDAIDDFPSHPFIYHRLVRADI